MSSPGSFEQTGQAVGRALDDFGRPLPPGLRRVGRVALHTTVWIGALAAGYAGWFAFVFLASWPLQSLGVLPANWLEGPGPYVVAAAGVTLLAISAAPAYVRGRGKRSAQRRG